MNRAACVVGMLVLLTMGGCATGASATTAPAQGSQHAGAGYHLDGVTLEQTSLGSSVMLAGKFPNGEVRVRRLREPERLLIDVEAAPGDAVEEHYAGDGAIVAGIRTESYDVEGRSFVRLVVECGVSVRYSTVQDAEGFRVTLISDQSMSADESVVAASAQPAAESTPATETSSPSEPEAEPAVSASEHSTSVYEPQSFEVQFTAVSVQQNDAAATITLKADRSLRGFENGAAVFSLANPSRLVFDFVGAHAASSLKDLTAANSFLTGVRFGRHDEKLRVVVDLNPGVNLAYSYEVKGTSLVLRIGSGVAVNLDNPAPLTSATAVVKTPQAPAQKPAAVVASQPTPEAVVEPQPKARAAAPAEVKGVVFGLTKRRTTIEVLVDGRPSYTTGMTPDGYYLLSISGVSVPSHLEQSLDTSEFNGAVSTVSMYQSDSDSTARVVVKAGDVGENWVEAKDGKVLWHFANLDQRQSPYEGRVTLNGKGEVAIEYTEVADAADAPASSASTAAAGSTTIEVVTPESQIERRRLQKAREQKRYRGEKISLELKDADIRDVLRLIAEVSKLNIVAADNITGLVTVRLINVPWDLALEVILKSKGYGMVQKGRIIRVAPQSTLDAEWDSTVKREMVTLYTQPLRVFLIPVSYSTAKNLVPMVEKVLSPRGEVTVDERTNIIIIKDIETYGQKAERLVSSLDLKTPQVVIEARIVEAQIINERGFGIQWGFNGLASSITGNPTGLVFPYTVGAAGSANSELQSATGIGASTIPNWVVNTPASGSTTGIGFTFGSVGNAFNLDLRLSALENEGSIKIISSPRIATMDNTQASIKQGAQIPALIETSSIDPTTGQLRMSFSTRQIETGTELKVTPHITADGSIMMQIEITKKDPDFSRTVQGMPTVLEKEAKTELLAKSGETVVIGGMYSSKISKEEAGTPFLMHIPVIGWLFKSRNVQEEKTELLIFLTPRIVVTEDDGAKAEL